MSQFQRFNALTKPLRVCMEHPKPVIFDGEKCPACQAAEEFLKLTDALENPQATPRPKGMQKQ